MSRAIVALGVMLAAAGCRPDPGPSQYEQQEPFPQTDGGDGALPGPMPYQPGQKRLSVGAFYESGSSDVIAVDNMSSNVYIYEKTVTLLPDPEHIEGRESTRVTHTGLLQWWGFGINWMAPRDLSAWTHMHISLRSSDAAFASVQIGMNNATTVFLLAESYGFVNDGQWHNLNIPVADFVAASLDKTQVMAPFVLSGGPGMGGEKLEIDDLYFTAD